MCPSEPWRPGTDDCAQLLRSAFPGLALDSLIVLGEGWDSVAFLINDELVFRLPKREDVAHQLVRERMLIEAIADRLPTQVPRCTWIAPPVPGFPLSVAGYPRIPGTPLSHLRPAQANDRLEEDIGQFLRALHGIDLDDHLLSELLSSLTPDEWWQNRWDLFVDSVPVIDAFLPIAAARGVRDRWERALADARAQSFEPCLIHGDLAAEHILVSESGRLNGVIDFGDAGPGDPALDLAGLPEPFAGGVIRRYAGSPEHRVQLDVRRRFYRLTVPFHAIRAGQDQNRPELIELGLAGIRERFDV